MKVEDLIIQTEFVGLQHCLVARGPVPSKLPYKFIVTLFVCTPSDSRLMENWIEQVIKKGKSQEWLNHVMGDWPSTSPTEAFKIMLRTFLESSR